MIQVIVNPVALKVDTKEGLGTVNQYFSGDMSFSGTHLACTFLALLRALNRCRSMCS